MQILAPDDSRPVHFMGIGGAGMSALALIACRRGVRVTGCDTSLSEIADIEKAGAAVWEGHDPSHIEGIRALIHTSAIPSQHPEVQAAQRLGVPVLKRARALGELVAGGAVIGVAGTHGKTTTTVMLTEALEAAGADPTGVAGGRVSNWGGNARIGSDGLFVVEADEYDRSFLELHPTIAIVNNLQPDHLECYGSMEQLEAAFADFASRGRVALCCSSDRGSLALAGRLSNPKTVGEGRADYSLSGVARDANGSSATLSTPAGEELDFRLRVPGLHNVRNAAMALAAVCEMKADVEKAIGGLYEFRGVGRRFEERGTAGGVVVVDDYAHHHAEIVATLGAARQRYPKRRVVAVFQPHLYSRTRDQWRELGLSLAAADVVVVTEIYPAREKPIKGVTGKNVADAAGDAGVEVHWVPGEAQLPEELSSIVKRGDVVLTLGAGTITHAAGSILEMLGARGEAA